MTNAETAANFKAYISKHKWMVWVGAILLVAIIAFSILSYVMNVTNEGQRQEKTLSKVYNESMVTLSNCLDKGQVAAQVTAEEYKSIKDILVSTVSARYVDDEGNDTSATGALGGGSFVSALQERYPQIDQRSWQNLQNEVIGCRDAFENSQKKVQAFVNNYEQWIVTDDLFNSWIKAGFPSEELSINIGNDIYLDGDEALAKLNKVVTVSDAVAAFETGVLETQTLEFNRG